VLALLHRGRLAVSTQTSYHKSKNICYLAASCTCQCVSVWGSIVGGLLLIDYCGSIVYCHFVRSLAGWSTSQSVSKEKLFISSIYPLTTL